MRQQDIRRPQGPTRPPARCWATPAGNALTLRPVQPEDAPLLGELLDGRMSTRSRRLRFHGAMGRLSAQRLQQLAEADFKRQVAFVVTEQIDGREAAVAEARFVVLAGGGCADFAVAVADDWQQQGIARQLMQTLEGAAAERGVQTLQGDVCCDNEAMRAVMRRHGYACGPHPEDGQLLRVERRLQTAASRPARRPARASVVRAGWQPSWLERLLGWQLALRLPSMY
jgi:acetyltransferase